MSPGSRAAIRVALTMAAILLPVFVVLALALPKSFFEDWGWLAGPAVWLAAALVAGRVNDLPSGPVAVAAVVAGLPSGLLVLAGLHDVGPLVSLPLFGWQATRGSAGVRLADEHR